MSTPTKPATGDAKPAQSAPKAGLSSTVQTLQFAWFIGHVLTVVGTLFFVLTYARVFPSSYKFWYRVALFGVVESFGILIFQGISKSGVNVKTLLREDNIHYFFLGVVLLVFSPYVLLTLAPFFLFASFHVLSYSKNFLLPSFGINDTHPLSKRIGDFVSKNNSSSIQLAALLEVYALVWLLVRVVTFRKVSLVPFVAYLVFIKLRFEKSAFTRNAVKALEIRVEDVVTKSGNPAVRDAWVKVKGVFAQVGKVKLASDPVAAAKAQ